MYTFSNFRNLMKKTGKKYKIVSKKFIFSQTYMEFVVANVTSKMMDTDKGQKAVVVVVVISKFSQRMNEQLLKVIFNLMSRLE